LPLPDLKLLPLLDDPELRLDPLELPELRLGPPELWLELPELRLPLEL
jgi:hypothetical protein